MPFQHWQAWGINTSLGSLFHYLTTLSKEMIPNAWSDTLLAQLCAFPHCHHFPGAEPSASLCFPTQEAAESSEASPPPALTTQCPQPPLTGHAFSTVTCFVALLLMLSMAPIQLHSGQKLPCLCLHSCISRREGYGVSEHRLLIYPQAQGMRQDYVVCDAATLLSCT